MKEFDATQQAFYDNYRTAATPFEAVQKRDALRSQLVSGEVGRNRNAALMAVTELSKMIEPPETAEQKQAKVRENILSVAQRSRDAGDELAAERTLKSVGIPLEALAPRAPNSLLDTREAAARKEYESQRAQGIASLRLNRGLNRQQATAVFDGKEMNPMQRLHPNAPPPPSSPVSTDSDLRKQVIRNHSFDIAHVL